MCLINQVVYRMLLIADTLSRSPLPDTAHELKYEDYDANILHTQLISEPKLEVFKQNTLADPALTDLIHCARWVRIQCPSWRPAILERL